MKAVVAAFYQEKALVGAFSVIVKTDFETDGELHSTNQEPGHQGVASPVLNSGSWAGHWPEQKIMLSFLKLWVDKFLVKINA